MSLKGKAAVVTGAGAGLGRTIALALARQGCSLTILDRDSAGLQQTSNAIEAIVKDSSKILQQVMDITDYNKCKFIIEMTVSKFGKIDILVNNAGIKCPRGASVNFEDYPIEDFDIMMKINTRAMIVLSQLAMPHLVSSKGNIVNMSSSETTLNTRDTFYAMTKAAVDKFTKSLAKDVAPRGVRVNSINPGAVKTNLLINAGFSAEESDKDFESFAPMHPIGRIGETSDIADGVVFLASSNASFITGHNLLIDGGIVL